VNFYLKVTLAVAVLVGAALALMFLLADAEEEVIAKLFESAVAAAQKGDAETVEVVLKPVRF